jgi:predicted metal-dependent peptidase
MSLSTAKLTDEERDFFKLLLIRATSSDHGQPHLAYALFTLTPVSSPGLKTMGVDKKWRVYVDFEYMMEKGVEYAAKVLNHEPWHLLLNHNERYDSLDSLGAGRRHIPMVWNIAGDLSINHGIEKLVPDDGCFPGKGQFKDYAPDLSSEQYYIKLMNDPKFVAPTCDECGQPDPNKDKNKDKGDKSKDKGDQPGDQGKGDQPGDDGEGDGDDEGKGEGSKPGDGNGTGESDQSGDGNGTGKSDQHGDGNGTCSTCGQEQGQGQGQPGDGAGGGLPDPNCGSGSGNLGDYELPSGDSSGIDEAEAEDVRRTIAEDIRSHEANKPGSVPGYAKVWADQVLAAKPLNWRNILRGMVKTAISFKKGQLDLNRSRRSRRQYNPDIIRPAWASPKPRLAVAVDTSGSHLHKLGIVVDEVVNITKSVGVRDKELLIFGVDTQVGDVRPVKNPKKILEEMRGGGGTDMRVGFEQLALLGRQNKADIGIMLTDLETGWPAGRPEGSKMKYIVVGIVSRGGKGYGGKSYVEGYIEQAEKALEGWANLVLIDTDEE